MQASGAPWPGGHAKSEEVSFYMPAPVVLMDGHAKLEEASSHMPAPAVLIDGWACKIERSFILHARKTKGQKHAGMQNRRKFHLACP